MLRNSLNLTAKQTNLKNEINNGGHQIKAANTHFTSNFTNNTDPFSLTGNSWITRSRQN